ncbi:NUDIX hydrolase [Halorientalis halophila]|uniref:NUDIX hydrolase n=1 Tax=Halorientalis halophila TaxID=3108499 RepID=UPI0030080C46
MNLAGRSRDHVESLLSALDDSYESFPVTQTTVSVPSETYDPIARKWRQEVARADVHVRNDAGEVLVSTDEEGPRAPSAIVAAGESLEEGARRAVTRSLGVECRLDGLAGVTIAGVQHEDDADANPIYRLLVVFTGQRVAGTPSRASEWRAEPPDSQLLI